MIAITDLGADFGDTVTERWTEMTKKPAKKAMSKTLPRKRMARERKHGARQVPEAKTYVTEMHWELC